MRINQLLAKAAKLLINNTWDNPEYSNRVDWFMYSEIFGIRDLADNTSRLYKSQKFGDEDYPTRVIEFLKKIAEKDEGLALDFISYVLKEELNLEDEEPIKEDLKLLKELGVLDSEIESSTLKSVSSVNHINVDNYPDEFYSDLQEEINKAFSYGLYSAVHILVRKLLENLVIDILREKYGMKNLNLFFNENQGRFQNFNVLIENLKNNISDFKPIEPAIDLDFVNKIDKFREKGNASAHSMVLDIRKEEIESELEEIEYIIKVLLRTLSKV